MKTLNIKSNGIVEINVDGKCFSTDVGNVFLPDTFKSAVAEIISSNQQVGVTEIHYEDNGFKQFCHKVINGDIETSDVFPSVFNNLANIVDLYYANTVAASEVKSVVQQQESQTTV